MNRAQRRAFNKQHKTSFTREEFDKIMALARLEMGQYTREDLAKAGAFEHYDDEELVPNGTKVKLNYENIMKRNVQELSTDFVKWVEDHKDEEFHVTREENSHALVCLEEDERYAEVDGEKVLAPKWLFDLYSDLLIEDDGEWVMPGKVALKNATEAEREAIAEDATKDVPEGYTDLAAKAEEKNS